MFSVSAFLITGTTQPLGVVDRDGHAEVDVALDDHGSPRTSALTHGQSGIASITARMMNGMKLTLTP